MIFSKLYPVATYSPDIFANFCIRHDLPITFDTSHIASLQYDVVTFFTKYHDHIKLIHISDFANGVQHLPLGKGNLPLRQLLKELYKVNYDGVISCEIYNHKDESKEERINDMKLSLKLLYEYLK